MPNLKGLKKGYTLPEQEEAAEKAKALRKQIANRTEAQHFNKALSITKAQKDAVKGIDHVTNMKEEEAEMLERKSKDR